MPRPRIIVSLNCGSSSLKFAAYRIGPGKEERLLKGAAERIGQPGASLWARDRNGAMRMERTGDFATHGDVLDMLTTAFESGELPSAEAVGHRVVHGGPDHFEPEMVTGDLVAGLKTCVPLAPLHLPPQIAAIEFIHNARPSLPQVACYDTTFHHRMPEIAQRFPLARDLWDEGVRKYGFHGLSYDYIVRCLGDQAKGAVIIAHLGNGASLAAVRDGRPVDTTMGLTPTGGMMMGTRSGDLDPGVLLYLLQAKGYDAARLAQLVEDESGLLGVSGTTSDMKRLQEIAATDPRAAQAIEMFCYQARKQIGALACALGGLDVLVFTGGIGERSSEVRRRTCQGLGFIGIELDPARNDAHASTISTPESRCIVRAIPTDEDLMVARYTHRVAFANR